MSDYLPPNHDLPDPDDLPNPNEPPQHGPSEEPVAPVPDEEEHPPIKLPENTDRDLTREFPDAEDDRPGREDPNILEDEEMEREDG